MAPDLGSIRRLLLIHTEKLMSSSQMKKELRMARPSSPCHYWAAFSLFLCLQQTAHQVSSPSFFWMTLPSFPPLPWMKMPPELEED